MTIRCKVCKYAILSTKPASQAQADVLKKLTQHLGVSHHEHATGLAQLLMTFQGLAGSYLLFGYAEIPPSEPALLASYNENKQALENILESEPILDNPAATAPSGSPVN